MAAPTVTARLDKDVYAPNESAVLTVDYSDPDKVTETGTVTGKTGKGADATVTVDVGSGDTVTLSVTDSVGHTWTKDSDTGAQASYSATVSDNFVVTVRATDSGGNASTAIATASVSSTEEPPVEPPIEPPVEPPVEGGEGERDETNTGVPEGTALQRVPQDVTSASEAGGNNRNWQWRTVAGQGVLDASDNAVIDGIDADGALYSNGGHDARNAGKITATNSRFRGTDEHNWMATFGPGSTATDCEFGGGSNGTTYVETTGVLSGCWNESRAKTVFTRCHFHHSVQLLRQDGDTEVIDCYFHDSSMGDVPGAHSECIFVSAGSGNVIRGSTLESGNSAVIFVQHGGGDNTQINGLEITDNIIHAVSKNGQDSSWGVSVENKGMGATKPKLLRNTFDESGFGAGPAQTPAGSTVSGNVYPDGSSADGDIETS